MKTIKNFNDYIKEDYNLKNEQINESAEWFEITKGLLAYDAISNAIGLGFGFLTMTGITVGGVISTVKNWLNKRKSEKEQEELRIKLEKIADKLKDDPEIKLFIDELQKSQQNNFTWANDTQKQEAHERNRKELLINLTNVIKRKLNRDEIAFLKDINKIIVDKNVVNAIGLSKNSYIKSFENFSKEIKY